MLAAVDLGTIFDVVWVSMLAGIGVTTLFSLVILAGGRSAGARRQGNRSQSLAYTGLAVLFFLAFAGVVFFGVNIMLSK